MRLQIIDPAVYFSCGSCTFCCDQPWHTHIETDKAHALDKHDFSRFPQLAGRKLYHKSSDAEPGTYILAKGEGTRCLFLDSDGLCIIHKELGPEAKPRMCLQFPYLPAHTQGDDRISVNFGCPSVQKRSGKSLPEQREDINVTIAPRDKPVNPNATVPLTSNVRLTLPEAEALYDRTLRIFDDAKSGSIWDRFAELICMLAGIHASRSPNAAGTAKAETSGEPENSALSADALIALLSENKPLPAAPALPAVTAYDNPSAAPSAARMLFAATIFRDTVPRGRVQKGLGIFARITLLPKLMSLARLTGSYPSLVLGRNVNIRASLAHDVGDGLDEGAQSLLLRYYRSRIWQRLLMGTRLTIAAGVHQHIQDLNAIIFYARAEAAHTGARQLTEAIVRKALTCVEFHFANQARAFDQKLVGYFGAQLQSLPVAYQSLRLMALRKRPASSESPSNRAGAST